MICMLYYVGTTDMVVVSHRTEPPAGRPLSCVARRPLRVVLTSNGGESPTGQHA